MDLLAKSYLPSLPWLAEIIMHDTIASFRSKTSAISQFATIGKGVKLAPFVYIADNAVIGDNVQIEPGAIIYENVVIGADSFIGAQCILGEKLTAHIKDAEYTNPPLIIGAHSIIRSGTIIYAGSTMGNHFRTGHRAVIRERSMFGDDCSFGTMSQSDGHIKVGKSCRFHNNVFISTYTTIEDNVHFYPMSCTVDSLHPPCQKSREGPYIESNAIIGAKALLMPRVRIGAGAVIAGASIVTHDVPPNMVASGAPAKVIRNKSDVRCHIEDRPAYEVANENS
jgi:acetyltransferase-like isoleucine patch superfamily enzyme